MSTDEMKYDTYKQGLVGYKGLAIAVIAQAAIDWRDLCEGKTETGDCNFAELTSFFKNEAKIYLMCSAMRPSQMLKILLREKAEKYLLNRRFTI